MAFRRVGSLWIDYCFLLELLLALGFYFLPSKYNVCNKHLPTLLPLHILRAAQTSAYLGKTFWSSYNFQQRDLFLWLSDIIDRRPTNRSAEWAREEWKKGGGKERSRKRGRRKQSAENAGTEQQAITRRRNHSAWLQTWQSQIPQPEELGPFQTWEATKTQLTRGILMAAGTTGCRLTT